MDSRAAGASLDLTIALLSAPTTPGKENWLLNRELAIIRLPGRSSMPTLELSRLSEKNIPMGTGWLLAASMEARGKQDLWISQKPEVLRTLREQALIQSTES